MLKNREKKKVVAKKRLFYPALDLKNGYFEPAVFNRNHMTLQQYIKHVYQEFISAKAIVPPLPEIDPEIIKRISQATVMTYLPQKEDRGNVCMAFSEEVRPEYRQVFTNIHLLDYCYAAVHAAAFAENKEFAEIDAQYVPSPKDAAAFWKLVELGGKLRQLHQLKSLMMARHEIHYPINGDNKVDQPRFVLRESHGASFSQAIGRVYINDTQYFDGVPASAWAFCIDRYRPARMWLNEQVGQKLESRDILHYQKIIVILAETERLLRKME